MGARGVSSCSLLQLIPFLFLCLYKSLCVPHDDRGVYSLMEINGAAIAPMTSISGQPQPFLPLLTPSPLTPFANSTVPILSGLCTLNFSAAERTIRIAATDCWSSFAPFLANVMCCPQLDATIVILMGQSGKYSGNLALDATQATHCLSDMEKFLEGQGANSDLQKICSITPENLTAVSCPVTDVKEFENIVDSSRLLTACEKMNPVNECCDQVCQKAILDAAERIALQDRSSLDGSNVLPENSSRIDDCKSIVLRWLSSKLDPSSANSILRGLSNCNVNKVCPLVFPNMKHNTKECGGVIRNQTACCEAMASFMSSLQEQSFITNLQALNCAALLGRKLQQANVSHNIYNLCHINLKDFSLQVGSQESGCLLPSLPSDTTYDKTSGIGFICDLNDNIAAPWPSASSPPPSSCNKTTKLPQLPAATSAQSGLYMKNLILPLLLASSLLLKLHI